jgi:GDPmannose 4,6-dehydratase
MSKTAVVFGCSGQDGSYLAELLLSKGYEVVGVCRRSSVNTHERLESVLGNPHFRIEEGEITDPSSITGIFNQYQPDECYNLAAQSHVGTSFKQPALTFQVDAIGVLNILETIRLHSPKTRFYQASTSEMFGSNYDTIYGRLKHNEELLCSYNDPSISVKFQDEKTQLSPNSPYAVAKVAAHNLIKLYRDSYGIFAAAGILFNHESPRRGENFVTKKITKWIGEFHCWKNQEFYTLGRLFIPEGMIHLGKPTAYQPELFPKLRLGNIKAYRDWGHAKDYVEAMWLMLQQEKPDDFVIATGETHSVEDFLTIAFQHIGIDDWKPYIVIDPAFYRPSEVEYLRGHAGKAHSSLGWKPKVSFEALVKEMINHDIQKARESYAKKL